MKPISFWSSVIFRWIKKNYPILILGATAAILFFVAWKGNKFVLVPEPDDDYNELINTPRFWMTALSGLRPWEYPLALRLIHWLHGSVAPWPMYNFGLAVLAVFVFLKALGDLGFEPFLRSVLAVSLLLSHVNSGPAEPFYGYRAGYDTMCLSLVILAISWFWSTWIRGERTIDRLILAGLVFAVVFSRGEGIILIPLLPLLLALFHYASGSTHRKAWTQAGKQLAFLGSPILVYCLIRFFVVGEFRVYSFGGTTQICLTGQLLNSNQLEKLPNETRPLAARMLELRAQEPLLFKSPVLGHIVLGSVMAGQVYFIYSKVAIPAATEQCTAQTGTPASSIETKICISTLIQKLSSQLLRLNLILFLSWVAKAFCSCVKVALLWTQTLVPILFLGAGYIAFVIRSWILHKRTDYLYFPLRAHVIMVSGISWFVLRSLAICTYSIPLNRYIMPAAIFLPTTILAVAWYLLKSASPSPGGTTARVSSA